MSSALWAIGLTLLIVGILALWQSKRTRQTTGLPSGKVIYADTGDWQATEAPIISHRWGLVGRPDYLVSQGDEVIPVEVKSGHCPRQPYRSHLLQLGAYCLLVEDWTGRRPSHGLLRYADATVEVPFDRALRQAVINTLSDIRRDAHRPHVPRSHEDPMRCARCGVRHACDQRL